MEFYKMHGTGNDFIMIDNFEQQWQFSAEKIQQLCDRHFGIGADGVILVESPTDSTADAFMNYWNADGTVAEMCGNGTRCTAHFLELIKKFSQNSITLQTRAGNKAIILEPEDQFTVNMGAPQWDAPELFSAQKSQINGLTWHCASMGNPHAVTFFAGEIPPNWQSIGEELQTQTSLFPQKINANFVSFLGENHLRVQTYERGSGATLACGTGACAAFACAEALGKCGSSATLELPGGTLKLQYNAAQEILMTGPSQLVFKGEINPF